MKTIYTACVDPERGKYLAFNDEGGMIMVAESYTSADEAVGRLVSGAPDFFQVTVRHVEQAHG